MSPNPCIKIKVAVKIETILVLNYGLNLQGYDILLVVALALLVMYPLFAITSAMLLPTGTPCYHFSIVPLVEAFNCPAKFIVNANPSVCLS